MPKLLVELGTEEIPAGYLAPALAGWVAAVGLACEEARLVISGIETAATPRRLVLSIGEVAEQTAATEEEVQGPPVARAFDEDGNATPVLTGFLHSRGLGPADYTTAEVVTGKGNKKKTIERIVATVREPRRPAAAVLPALLAASIGAIPFPKRMHWGARFSAEAHPDRAEGPPRIEFARPLRYVVSLLGTEVLPLPLGELPVGRATVGHAFLGTKQAAGDAEAVGGARGPLIELRSADLDLYADALADEHVVLREEDRAARIKELIEKTEKTLGVSVAEADRARLVPEVANLVEYPGHVIGVFDPAFLDLPDEVLRASMIGHQRYFPLAAAGPKGLARDAKVAGVKLADRGPGALTNAFLAIIDRATDPHGLIRDGNARVLAARLSDAQFFWAEDRKQPLDDFLPRLDGLVFHQALGTFTAKSARLVRLVESIARALGMEAPEQTSLVEAARLAKADLVTQMVVEFTELQGVMGGAYLRAQGADEAVAEAVGTHYEPAGRDAPVPASRLGKLLSLADKLDDLAGYFLIGADAKKGGDPLGLRRRAIAVVRLMHALDEPALTLTDALNAALMGVQNFTRRNRKTKQDETIQVTDALRAEARGRLLAYIGERFRNFAREQGYAHDHIDAVAGSPAGLGHIADAFRRLAGVQALAPADAGGEGNPAEWDLLLELAERTANITRGLEPAEIAPDRFEQDEERELFAAYEQARPKVVAALDKGDYAAAANTYRRLLSQPVHDFFDAVLVLGDAKKGTEVPARLRDNRLALLRAVYRLLADRFAALDRVARV